MSIFTSAGKVSDIFVNHEGVKKPVLSGWANLDGAMVLVYKRGGNLPFESEELKLAYAKHAAKSPLVKSSEFDATNVKKIMITGTIRYATASSSAASSSYSLAVVAARNTGNVTTTLGTWTAYSYSSSGYKQQINVSYDVADTDKTCCIWLNNIKYSKYLGCELTITLS